MLALPLCPVDAIEAFDLRMRERTLFALSTSAEAIPDHRLTDKHRRLLTYWKAKRDRYDAPCRSAIDPCDLGPILPNILLWDMASSDYRCRLAGTEVCHHFMGKLQGALLSDLHCPLRDQTRCEFDAARDQGLATLVERSLDWLGRPLTYYRHLLLPLVNEQGRRHMLLGVMTFHNAAA